MSHRRLFSLVLRGFVTFCLAIAVSCSQQQPAPESEATPLLISAAASVTDAMEEVGNLYTQQQPNTTIQHNFGSSGALQQQIEQGAPADIFLSAAQRQMDALEEQDLILPETRKNLLQNTIVLIVPRDGETVNSFSDLNSGNISRIAVGEFESVPAGQYAEEVLTNLGILEDIRDQLVFGNNVRQVLSFVEAGNADAGLVYATDAALSDRIKIVESAPANSHSPIVYPIAVVKDSDHPEAAQNYLEFLSGETAKSVFEKYGFKIAN